MGTSLIIKENLKVKVHSNRFLKIWSEIFSVHFNF